MKNIKKLLASIMVIAIVLTLVPGNVFAITDEQRSNLVEIILRQAIGISVNGNTATIEYENGRVEVDGNDLQGVTNDNWNFGDHIGSMIFLYTSSTSLTFKSFPSENFNASVWQAGQPCQMENGEYTISNLKKTSETDENYDVEFVFEDTDAQHGPGPEEGEGWTGDSVYFVWATEGEEGNFYYKKIDGVVGGGDMNYVPVSTIVAENDPTVKYNITNRERNATHSDGVKDKAQSYEFAWTDGFEQALTDSEFAKLSTTGKMDYLYENGIAINPIGALNGENCISNMGDLAFKLTIYNDAENTYEAVRIGVPDNYEYYPAFWDPVFHWDLVDISGTTEDAPATFEAFLLEKTLVIDTASYSREITEVKAIGVPNKAVSISKVSNGKFAITYSSNYYDNVEFELTDKNGQKYYIILNRVNVLLKNLIGDETRENYAAIYYPASDSYEKYSVILNINYSDGTSETKLIAKPNKGLDAENGDFQNVYEYTGGENLKTAWYKLDGIKNGQDSNIEDFSITVVKDYNPSAASYGGTLSGAGEGNRYVDNGHFFERVMN